MDFNLGNLVSGVVGAIARAATAIVNALSPIAEGGGLFAGIAGALVGAAAVVANVCEDGEIDAEELFNEVFKLVIGAFMLSFGSGSSLLIGARIPKSEKLENGDEITNYVKDTDIYKQVTKGTQDGYLSTFLDVVGFDRDEDEVYHAQQDGWQQYLGYNNFYDYGFDFACSMDYEKFPFSTGNEDYVIWLWKGDYLNLGAGAETGIYSGGGPHWKCATENTMPMTLRLEDEEGNPIFDWKPQDDNWWCTGFNPDYQNAKEENLTAYGSIDFSDPKHLDMWDAFYKRHKKNTMWTFDSETHIAKFKW